VCLGVDLNANNKTSVQRDSTMCSMVKYFRLNSQHIGGLIYPFKKRDLHFDELIQKQ
jgi:hypothetical protein